MNHDIDAFIGPRVVCVRGPSRSGKSTMCERLVTAFESAGVRTAYIKRAHHRLDLPEKASGRVWSRGPSAMVVRAPDRTQVTLPPGDDAAERLVAALPTGIDLVLLETHSPEPFPSLLARSLEPAPGERLLGRWAWETLATDLAGAIDAVRSTLPRDRRLDHALRSAMRVHGGHACAGLVLGTRLALEGAARLGLDMPDTSKRLLVTVETDRCAVDAVQAVTGCRPGKRTLRLLDYGKLAATFVDTWSGVSVRVAARPGLRERVDASGDRHDRHERQRLAYLQMAPSELFVAREVDGAPSQFDLPGPPRRRVTCTTCGEEVSDGREVSTDAGDLCRPCAAEAAPTP